MKPQTAKKIIKIITVAFIFIFLSLYFQFVLPKIAKYILGDTNQPSYFAFCLMFLFIMIPLTLSIAFGIFLLSKNKSERRNKKMRDEKIPIDKEKNIK